MNADAATGELGGTAAIVTGSAKNIGRATALALAEAGAAVLINARTSVVEAGAVKSEIEAAGGRAIVHMADVTREDQVQGMVAAAVAAFGRLDILVNNVASRSALPIVETTLATWQAVLSSALDSTFLCTPVHPRLGAPPRHGRARLHRQCGRGVGPCRGRQPQSGGDGEGGARRLDRRARHRACAAEHPGQLRLARPHQHHP